MNSNSLHEEYEDKDTVLMEITSEGNYFFAEVTLAHKEMEEVMDKLANLFGYVKEVRNSITIGPVIGL